MAKRQINSRPTVTIIGAGVAGLAVGWRLAQAGAAVNIFDRAAAGHGASYAAAGLLAAGLECEPGETWQWPLNRWSQELWPEFVAELEAASGTDLGYRDEGTLAVAPTRDDAARLQLNANFQREQGIELEWLSGARLRKHEPCLRPAAGAVLSRKDHHVDNRRLVEALVHAVQGAGATLHEHISVDSVAIEAGRVVGLVADGERHRADVVVLAAGAWSRHIGGLPEALRPPVRPVKGQMLALRMDAAAPILHHAVFGPAVYMVPRREGRLLIGATVEERGFDDALTAGGVLGLLEAAWRLLPGIEELPIDEMWVGHRPTSRDDAPILGPTPIAGLLMATGHHRNGILQTPVTAEILSRFVLDGVLAPQAEPFTLDRFCAPGAASRRAVGA